MARPKVLSNDIVRVEVAIRWEQDAELNAVAEVAGVSKAALIRTFLTYGLRAYTNAWLATAPPPSAPRIVSERAVSDRVGDPPIHKFFTPEEIAESTLSSQTSTRSIPPHEKAGFKPHEVSRWMGHASVSTTDGIYAHLYPSDYSDDIARFEAFVAEGRCLCALPG